MSLQNRFGDEQGMAMIVAVLVLLLAVTAWSASHGDTRGHGGFASGRRDLFRGDHGRAGSRGAG